MVSVLKKNLSDSVWTGGNDILSEGVWRWGNTPIGPYTAWYGDNPSSNDGNEHCLELRRDGNFLWNDNNCNARHYFVCEHGQYWFNYILFIELNRLARLASIIGGRHMELVNEII
ncbi:hypothetical protein BsWGS_24833 [Bradybaena similaris]